MELSELMGLIYQCRAQDKYLYIYYNGMFRNVWPVSFRQGPGGLRMHAWCEIHPQELSESFLVGEIYSAKVSEDDAYYKPLLAQEIS